MFATDYPQEIRERDAVRDFVSELRALGKDGEAILSGNVEQAVEAAGEGGVGDRAAPRRPVLQYPLMPRLSRGMTVAGNASPREMLLDLVHGKPDQILVDFGLHRRA